MNHGREYLNFSDWTQPNEDFEMAKEMIEGGEMPLWNYVLMHEEADLTPEEQEALLRGLQATFAQDPPIKP